MRSRDTYNSQAKEQTQELLEHKPRETSTWTGHQIEDYGSQ